jgi:hypothetical protein
MKRFSTLFVLMLGALALVAAGGADPGNKGKGKKAGGHGKHSFVVTTTDNGSCGGPWATDTVRRTFLVKLNRDGSYTLTRRDRGTFVTLGGTSPGACDTTGRHGHTVQAGVHGRFAGFLRGRVTGGTYNPNAQCSGPDCGFTDVFVTTFFGPGATFSCFENSTQCKFNFNYTAPRQHLLFRHWQDKGKGAGTSLRETFHGDIADA